MTLMPRIVYGKCYQVDKNTVKNLEMALTADGDTTRLNTIARMIGDATPDLPWFEPRFREEFGDYVVIQPAAGRPDNSFRCFMPYAIMELVEHFAGKKIVLLGAEFKGAVPENVVNLTNKTAIKTAVEIVKGADHFVGFDGFLAYVAMSLRVSSTVIFHDSRLPEHYMNPQWEEHTKWMIGPQRISDQINHVIDQC
jgi:ADP-heptose:LPS heptosyltransferase